MSSIVPLTISASTTKSQSPSRIGIGKNNFFTITPPPNAVDPLYWILIVDRSTLQVKENFTFSDNAAIPAKLSVYLGHSQYLMIFTTYQMFLGNFPTGKLYKFLMTEGAGLELKRAEQIAETINCSAAILSNYTLVSVLGNDGGESFEEFMLYTESNLLVTTLQLIPFSLGGKTLYTPAEIT